LAAVGPLGAAGRFRSDGPLVHAPHSAGSLDSKPSRARARPPLVLAPSHDGGVNLIGLARFLPELLSPIVPGSPTVARDLSAAARRLGYEVVLLPSGPDLDRIADVSRAYALSASEAPWRPYRSLLRAVLRADIL